MSPWVVLKSPPYTDSGIRVWPIDFFIENRAYLAYGGQVQKHINNHAMKFLRDQVEAPAGVPGQKFGAMGLDVTFPQLEVCQLSLPQIIHGDKELKTSQSWSFEWGGTPELWS